MEKGMEAWDSIRGFGTCHAGPCLSRICLGGILTLNPTLNPKPLALNPVMIRSLP